MQVSNEEKVLKVQERDRVFHDPTVGGKDLIHCSLVGEEEYIFF